MKRCLALGALLTVGVLSLTLAAFQGPQAGLSPAAVKATAIEKVKDNLYVITGSRDLSAFSGGNTAVFITDTGVVLVDTKLPGWGPTILQLLKTVTSKPVTAIINTHSHGDHTGGNEFFGATVDSIVHENAKTNMARMTEFSGDHARFLPKRTYKDKLTVGKGKDQIDLYYFGRGHTNGDTFVVFPALRTVHTGDLFASKMLPLVDAMNGGSVLEYPQTLAKAVSGIKNVETVIPGHIPVTTWSDFREYASFTQNFVDYARAAAKAKKTVEQAAAGYKVPPQYKGYVVTVDPQLVTSAAVLGAAYAELEKQR